MANGYFAHKTRANGGWIRNLVDFVFNGDGHAIQNRQGLARNQNSKIADPQNYPSA